MNFKNIFLSLLCLAFLPSFALADTNFEGTWVGSGGSLKNSRGYESRCESARLEVLGAAGTYYQVVFVASCGGIPYNQTFYDVKAQGNQILLNDPWGWIAIINSGERLHASGRWFNITWPNTIGFVDANLEIDLVR